MSPAPLSPVTKLSHSHRSLAHDTSADGIRKRVCKACDRCRLKKSKCDGSSPCSRCKVDNAICVFGERKKSHDKVYPKGYVEMLEQQQSQLVAGLQEMYRRLQSGKAWESDALPLVNGQPLTHDILSALNLLEVKHDGSNDMEMFEEDCLKLQSKLIADGHALVRRRGSFSSDSDHSQHGAPQSASTTTPMLSKADIFKDSFAFGSNASSPLVESPGPIPKHERAAPQAPPLPSTYSNDPQLYNPEWAQALNDASMAQLQSKFNVQFTDIERPLDDLDAFNGGPQWIPDASGNFNTYPPQFNSFSNAGDMVALDALDIDFSKFVNPATEVYI